MPDHDAHPLGDDKGGSQRQRAERLKKTIDESHGMWGAGDLKYAVHDALQLPAPKGDSGKLGELAAAYNTAGSQVDQIQMKVAQVSSQHLPDAWTGQVGEKAAEVVKASADDLGRCRDHDGQGPGPAQGVGQRAERGADPARPGRRAAERGAESAA
ncbi:hypothetical protein [Kitasatospora sp. NPDC058190]|uniref:hypothetical protein n=1 Tax=Kitasatospora sp. NPDC058190 TaxID=3346371 RepID=UPI0036DB3C99